MGCIASLWSEPVDNLERFRQILKECRALGHGIPTDFRAVAVGHCHNFEWWVVDSNNESWNIICSKTSGPSAIPAPTPLDPDKVDWRFGYVTPGDYATGCYHCNWHMHKRCWSKYQWSLLPALVETWNQEAAAAPDAVTLSFEPWLAGWTREGNTIVYICPGTQAEKAGVKVGWTITGMSLDGNVEFQVGMKCLAWWAKDSKYYGAIIEDITHEKDPNTGEMVKHYEIRYKDGKRAKLVYADLKPDVPFENQPYFLSILKSVTHKVIVTFNTAANPIVETAPAPDTPLAPVPAAPALEPEAIAAAVAPPATAGAAAEVRRLGNTSWTSFVEVDLHLVLPSVGLGAAALTVTGIIGYLIARRFRRTKQILVRLERTVSDLAMPMMRGLKRGLSSLGESVSNLV